MKVEYVFLGVDKEFYDSRNGSISKSKGQKVTELGITINHFDLFEMIPPAAIYAVFQPAQLLPSRQIRRSI